MNEQQTIPVIESVHQELRCHTCEAKKPLSDFVANKSKAHGVNRRCRECEREARKTRAGSVVRIEKRCSRCKEVKPIGQFGITRGTIDGHACQCAECYSWSERERIYGISREQYEAILEEQRGLCAICSHPSSSLLHIDHCHKTKKVRGLLCGNCNRALGLFKDSPTVLRQAAKYMEAHI